MIQIQRVFKIFFSATGTTKRVVDAVGNELSENAQTYDFTLPAARKAFPLLAPDDLVVFGLPTYAGRLPNLLLNYLATIEGNGAWAIPVVTFGNRSFDNSLIELRNLLENHHFRTISAGAFSCEHSFSRTLAAGRPDAEDLDFARHLAAESRRKMEALNPQTYSHIPVAVEGDSAAGYYQPRTDEGATIDIRKVKPKTSDACLRCGTCANVCPMGSISPDDFSTITGICIKCCACVKRCPVQAKYFDDPGYLYHKEQLERRYPQPAPNRMFL